MPESGVYPFFYSSFPLVFSAHRFGAGTEYEWKGRIEKRAVKSVFSLIFIDVKNDIICIKCCKERRPLWDGVHVTLILKVILIELQ